MNAKQQALIAELEGRGWSVAVLETTRTWLRVQLRRDVVERSRYITHQGLLRVGGPDHSSSSMR